MSAAASRRGFLAALTAFTGTSTTAGVAVAASLFDRAEPDAELLAAELRWRQAIAFRDEVEERHAEAARAEERAVGPCPEALFLSPNWDWSFAGKAHTREASFRWENWHGTQEGGCQQAWTVPTLRKAITLAPTFYGRGGVTPHVIRRLRALLPLAEERDAAWAAAEARYGSSELYPALAPAREAVKKAEDQILDIPATTVVGAGVKARFAKHWLFDHASRGGYSLKQPECMLAVLGAVLDITGTPGDAI